MNSNQRKLLVYQQHQMVEALPAQLTLVPLTEFPSLAEQPDQPIMAWRSRKYLVQLWLEPTATYPLLLRLSICRVKIGNDGKWQDGLTWEELQQIKADVGYDDWYGMEIYPQAKQVVNVANFRHLWLLPEPLEIGWNDHD